MRCVSRMIHICIRSAMEETEARLNANIGPLVIGILYCIMHIKGVSLQFVYNESRIISVFKQLFIIFITLNVF